MPPASPPAPTSPSVPLDLTLAAQWLCWRLGPPRTEKGKGVKLPISAHNGGAASVTDPSTWCSFAEALAYQQLHQLAGIGFVFTEDDPYFGIDLDGCIDLATGEIADWAMEIVTEVDSYTEFSPSRTGLHVIGRGRVPSGGNRKGPIEMYDRGRYFTVTGLHLAGTPKSINERQVALTALHARVFPQRERTAQPQPPQQAAELPFDPESSGNDEPDTSDQCDGDLEDDELIEHARRAKNGAKFKRLWSGDTTGYTSQSEADMALCAILRFWTRSDAERIDRLFRRSGLLRKKWDEKHGDRTYGERTIAAILAHTADVAQRSFKLTDLGNAERLVARHGKDLRFCWAWRKWIVWTGRYWKVGHEARVRQFAKDTVRAMYHEAASYGDTKARDALLGWAHNSEKRDRIQAMIELAKSEPGVWIDHESLDRQHWILNCANGALDLRTGQLREHRREDLLTKSTAIRYDATAACPQWTAFLERVLPIEAVRSFLQRAAGYALTGDVSEQVLIFLVGGGANGKSTVLLLFQSTLGAGYAIQAASNLLLRTKHEPHPTDIADLFGIRLAACTEMGVDRKFDEVRIKQLTGGDRIRARRMKEDFWEFPPTHKLFIAANHKPTIEGTDEAIWRRILLVPFVVTIPEKQRDKKLVAKLQAELPGILRWLVEGCLAWQRDGLNPPDEVRAATADYREDMDTVGEFVDAKCVINARRKVNATELFLNYVSWCEHTGNEAQSQTSFGATLFAKGFERRKKHGTKWYLGIDLRRSSDPGGDGWGRLGTNVPIAALDPLAKEPIGESLQTVPNCPHGDGVAAEKRERDEHAAVALPAAVNAEAAGVGDAPGSGFHPPCPVCRWAHFWQFADETAWRCSRCFPEPLMRPGIRFLDVPGGES